VKQGGLWVTIYCLMFAVSIYLVMQSLEAMLFRFLLLALPGLLAWGYAGRAAALRVSEHRRPAFSGRPG
jgi:hypothetical protein